MAKLAIITARGGSKRIPRKNIRSFLGKPIIAYSIEAALKSNLFDEVMVSTDDVEIAEIAKNYGATVPFARSLENSNDFAGTSAVILEVLDVYKSKGITFDQACCIYPTAPFVSSSRLKEAYNILVEENYSSVFPVCPFSYPILRGLKRQDNGKIEMLWPENQNKRSQDLDQSYHDAGQFYWIAVEAFIANPQLFSENSGAIILSELEVQDIDNETDWELAEMKYTLIKSKENA